MNHWLAMLTNCHFPRRSAAHIGQEWPLLVCATEQNTGRFAHIPLRPGQQETLALLKILALGNQDVADVVTRLRAKRAAVYVANPNYVLDELIKIVESLSTIPERGSHPKELVSVGIKEYRQTFFKPYRVIYRVTGSQVILYLVADSHRDMQSVLARRLLGA